MPNERKEDLDRRDFMMAAVGLVGAPTSLASSVDTANARDTKAAPVGLEPGARQRTVYTGDVIQGKKVISALDVNDLERGRKHAFYFEGVQMPAGQHWYVSVLVAVGATPGKRVVLTSGVQGDEMSPVHMIQTVMSQLDPAQMSGTVPAVPDVSRPALEGMARRWPNSGRGIDLIDINREWPGNEHGASAPSRHAGLLFNRLLRPNADYALDIHTGATGFAATGFNLARMELPEVRAMAELFPIDQIFDHPAYPTLLANAYINVGIPGSRPRLALHGS
jgi:predicted deacylase